MGLENARKDFPILGRKINGKNIVYLDNACVTLRPLDVVNAMNEYYLEYPACVGRSSHKLGLRATEEYAKSRGEIAKFVNSNDDEIIFTRNTTEGLNLVLHSLGLEKGDAIITTDKEHNSMLVPIQLLGEKAGIVHKIVPSKQDLTFDMERFKESFTKNTKLVAMVHTSNLDGCTIPAKEIIGIAHDNNALVLLDSAQSVPHAPVDMEKLDCDFMAFSGHKMLGPSGIGILYGKGELLKKLNPFMAGGATVNNTTYETHEFLKPPEKFEAGLQNYAGAIGLAAAVRYLKKVGMDRISRHEAELNKYITDSLSEMKNVKIIGPADPKKRGGIIPFVVGGIDHHEVAVMLDQTENVMIRAGQHCVHSWFNAHKIKGTCRASLYFYNNKEDAEIFTAALKKIIELI